MIRKCLPVVASIALILGLAACGSSSHPSSASTPSAAASSSGAMLSQARAAVAREMAPPTAILQTVPLPSAPPKGKTFIMLTANNPAAQEAWQGAQAAAQAVGWKFSHIEYNPANPASLQSAFSSALAQHPTVVCESGLPQSLFGASTISAYKKAGVPIIVAAAAPVQPTSEILGPVQGSAAFDATGTGLANWFVADSNGKGQALVANVPGFPVLSKFKDSFQSTVANLCPSCGVKVIDITLPQVAGGQLVSTVVSTLRANPKIDYVVFDDADFGLGIVSALKAAGLTNVKVAGQIQDTSATQALRDGTEAAWMGWSGSYQGYAAVDLALRWVEKAPLTNNDDLSPTQLLTHANIGQTTVWSQPADALAQFKKLWHVS